MSNGYGIIRATKPASYAPYQSTGSPRRVVIAPRKQHWSAGFVMGRLLIVFALVALCVVAFYGSRGYSMYREALAETSVPTMVEQIEASPGFTPIEELPQRYLDAVVAVEDHRFYLHPGFDVIATGRALVNDLRAGSFVEGGSTITQQLAKNQFFTQDRELERKVAEVFMAFELESHLPKSDVLELYVNSIYFGNGYYGIHDASMGYFGKEPAELTDYEATMLAGIPNAPSAYAPTANPELAKERQLQVLRQMVEYKMITPAESTEIAQAA